MPAMRSSGATLFVMDATHLNDRIRHGAATTLAAAGASLALAACSAGSTATQTAAIADSGAVVVAVSGTPATLDFTTTGGAAIPQAMMSNIYETLVRIDDDGHIVPWLATDWDVSEDRTVYTFHLRDGVTFANGSPFTAETAKFSIDRVLSDAWTNGLKKLMSPVADTRVVDTHTLEVTLNAPSNQWLFAMGTFVGAMMTPDGVDALATDPVGTGPYTVTDFALGQSITFAARDDYWGEAPRNDAAAIRYFADAVGATNALRSGDVDAVYSMQSPELLDTITAHGHYNVEVGTTNGEVLLSMNNRRAPFDDIRVRRAVMYAIDRQAVIDTAWDGFGTDTGGAPVPPTDPWYEKSDRYPHDPEKARQLLAEAGIDGTNNRVVISVPSRPYATAVSEIIVSQLRDIGFDARIEATEFPAVWLQKVFRQHDYDMSIILHIEARDVPALFGDPDYYLGFDSPAVREDIARADAGSPEEYVSGMRAAVDTIMDQAAADTLFNYPNIVITAPGVTGANADAVDDALELATISVEEERD